MKCWQCGGELQKNYRTGGVFKTTRMINGHEQTLHIICAQRYDSYEWNKAPHIWPSKQYDLTDDNH